VRDHPPILIKVPVRLRRRGVEAKLIVLDQQHPTSGPDPNLVKALTRAHEWFARIIRDEANGIGDIARAERLDRSYVARVLCLAFLSPEITNALLAGRQPTELTAKRLIRSALEIPLAMGGSAPPYQVMTEEDTVQQISLVLAPNPIA
jgi:hypothetical protein